MPTNMLPLHDDHEPHARVADREMCNIRGVSQQDGLKAAIMRTCIDSHVEQRGASCGGVAHELIADGMSA